MSFAVIDIAQLTTNGSLLSITNVLGEDHAKRIAKYAKHWRYYEGDQWEEPNKFNVTWNYVRRTVDLKVDFFAKNGFEVSIPDDPSTDVDESELRTFIKTRLDTNWYLNNKKVWLQVVSNMGGVTGDVFIRSAWIEETEFDDAYVKHDLIPSNLVFPTWEGVDNQEMSECIIVLPTASKNRPKLSITDRIMGLRNLSARKTEVAWRIEHHTKNVLRVYQEGKLVDTIEHNLGVIPVTHIRNRISANSFYGISDIDDLISLQDVINEKATDCSDIIDYHGSPIIALLGASGEDLDRGRDKIWSLPDKDSDVKVLEMKGDLKANLEYIEMSYKRMLEISATPEQAINPTKNVSNTPGVALHMSYLPLIDIRRVKETMYGTGISNLNKITIRMLLKKDPYFERKVKETSEDDSGKTPKFIYRTLTTFGEALPRDEIQSIENKRSKIGLGISTRERELVADGIGNLDAARIVKEADEEFAARAKLLAATSGKKNIQENDVFGGRRMPDPIIQGDKVSAGAAKV